MFRSYPPKTSDRNLLSIDLTVFLIAASAFYVAGYSRDVHPNVSRNLGGGQPDIVQIQFHPQAPIVEGISPRRPGISEPLIAWHQTSQFLYVASLARAHNGQASLIAIDIKGIAAIQQVPWAAELRGGNKIIAVHELN